MSHRKLKRTGVTIRYGLGCALHSNCFTCPEKKCRVDSHEPMSKRNIMVTVFEHNKLIAINF